MVGQVSQHIYYICSISLAAKFTGVQTEIFIRSFSKYWDESNARTRYELWSQITTKGNPFVRSLEPNVDLVNIYKGAPRIWFQLNEKDPASLLLVLFLFLVYLAIVPFELSFALVGFHFLAATVIAINWMIGSRWMIALYDLWSGSDESLYLTVNARGPNSPGVRLYTPAIMSGFPALDNYGFGGVVFIAFFWVLMYSVIFPALIISGLYEESRRCVGH